MRVVVNDEAMDLDGTPTVADLLAHLHLPGTRVAVEVNRKIVRRAEHPSVALSPDDRIEVVTLVGGG
jgi:thiamine biosynthesis protein ThiS